MAQPSPNKPYRRKGFRSLRKIWLNNLRQGKLKKAQLKKKVGNSTVDTRIGNIEKVNCNAPSYDEPACKTQIVQREVQRDLKDAGNSTQKIRNRTILTLKDALANSDYETREGPPIVHVPTVKITHKPDKIESVEVFNELQDCHADAKFSGQWLEFIKSDEQLKLATGIESFELLKAIVERMKLATNYKYETSTSDMNTENRVVMTYLKLKQNLMYEFLAIIFDRRSQKECEEIIKESVMTLGECLKTTAISWFSRQIIQSNMPNSFINFKNLRVLVDSIPIFMYTQTKFTQINGASYFRTVIGISPGGMISLVDSASGGNSSDSAVFEQSKLLNLLETGDGVIASTNFQIDTLRDKYSFQIIQCGEGNNPPEKNSALDSQTTQAMKIFRKVQKWIKEFEILNSFPIELAMYVDHITSVICATFNLSSPIIHDEELMEVT
ncbi:hypothetical protein QAD02_023294 [Eretmocerus hayati]|uniref:Uncharacterized protein n=1 Tax=Eretmocerus hayati TaxID=131215 RepID=A0ACC2PVP2_9HYME|nr:hypothetical protein QAD02_023294 [Eretmocerus hayati]